MEHLVTSIFRHAHVARMRGYAGELFEITCDVLKVSSKYIKRRLPHPDHLDYQAR